MSSEIWKKSWWFNVKQKQKIHLSERKFEHCTGFRSPIRGWLKKGAVNEASTRGVHVRVFESLCLCVSNVFNDPKPDDHTYTACSVRHWNHLRSFVHGNKLFLVWLVQASKCALDGCCVMKCKCYSWLPVCGRIPSFVCETESSFSF